MEIKTSFSTEQKDKLDAYLDHLGISLHSLLTLLVRRELKEESILYEPETFVRS